MKRKEFFEKLAVMYPRIPDSNAIDEYAKKFSEWHLSAKNLEKIYDVIIENHQYYPTLAEIVTIASSLSIGVIKKPEEANFLCFDAGGIRYAKPVRDPSWRPSCAGTNERIVLSWKSEAPGTYKPIYGEEAKVAFRQGYLEAGGKPELLGEMMGIITQKRKSDLKLVERSDYDDSEA